MKKQRLIQILFQTKAKHNEGFTLFEVLVAILAFSAFLMGTLQAMTINAVLQVRAEREAQASFWIQEDLEQAQAIASAMDLAKAGGVATCTILPVPSQLNNRFGGKLKDELNTFTTEVVGPQNFIQYEADAKGNRVFDSSTKAAKFNTAPVQDSVTGTNKELTVQVVQTEDLINKPYRLVRLVTVDRSTKYDVLQVYYRVGEPYDPSNPDPKHKDDDKDRLADDFLGKTSIIAENYTELIPAAVSQCTP